MSKIIPRVGSLFSGAGLGDLGLEWAGFQHAWFCETDSYARKVLELRWPGVPVYGDIREVDFTQVEQVDLLAGGFPCQDISIAGKGEGIHGERSGLWKEFARAIGEIRPRYALIENSPALVGRGLDVVLSDLAALGYDAEWYCISAAALGAPHKRDRIWIVGYASRYGRVQGRENHSGHDRAIPPTDGQHAGEMAHAEGQPEWAGFREDEQNKVGRGRSGDSGCEGAGANTNGVTCDGRGFGSGDVCGERPTPTELRSSSKNVRDIPNTAGLGRKSRRSESEGQQRAARIVGHCGEVPNTVCPGREELDIAALAARAGQCAGCAPSEWGKAWWSAEPGLGRGLDGFTAWLDKIGGLDGPYKELRTLWESIQKEEVQREIGGLNSIQETQVLFSFLCELKERGFKSWSQVESRAVAWSLLRKLREHYQSSSSPYRRGHYKQYPKEHRDTLYQLSRYSPSCIQTAWQDGSWENGLSRTAHGTPHRVDRLRCIGNGQVPHCTYFIGRIVYEHWHNTPGLARQGAEAAA